ncbi:MAG: hypothetical protein JNL32_01815 [Candidatus Kapabacteria bacterium]|nr:hypothetical protein [Candidatus Kapabacteria bacterium]
MQKSSVCQECKIIDHLGGTRMVLSDNATRLAQTDYAPFGRPHISTQPSFVWLTGILEGVTQERWGGDAPRFPAV